MNSNTIINIFYNELEYFTYINLFLLFFILFFVYFWIIINATTCYYVSLMFDQEQIELFISFFSFGFLLFIISPALIILLELDLIIQPSFLLFTLGYQ